MQFNGNLCKAAQMIDLPKDLLDLDLPGIERLGNWFSLMANVCADRAGRMREIESREARCDARADFLASSPLKVLDLLRRGYNSPESAVDAVAREMGVPEFTVLAQYRRFVRQKDKDARAARNALIIYLVRCGFTNDEIARRMGVHRNTISAAISEHLSPHLRPCDRQRLRKRRKEKQPG